MNFKKFANPEKNRISGYRAKQSLSLILLLVVVILMLVACTQEKKAQPERAINVQIATAEKKKIQPYLETTGTLKADEEVTVSSEVDGIVRQVRVDEGSPVNKGTLLVEINEIDYILDWKRSEAALKQAEANLANAQAEYKRKNTLYQEELITKQQFDDITTKIALAEAELDRAKATLAISKEKLVRTKVYSPLTGAVKEKRVSVGDYVRNGTPLLQLITINPLKLDFTISEKDTAAGKPINCWVLVALLYKAVAIASIITLVASFIRASINGIIAASCCATPSIPRNGTGEIINFKSNSAL